MSSPTIQLPEQANLAQCLAANPSINRHKLLVPDINKLIADAAKSFAGTQPHPNELHISVMVMLQKHQVTQSLPVGLRQEISYDLFKGLCACERPVNISAEPCPQLTQLFEKSLRHFWSE